MDRKERRFLLDPDLAAFLITVAIVCAIVALAAWYVW